MTDNSSVAVVTVQICKEIAAAHFGVSILDIDSARRITQQVEARHAAYWLAATLTSNSLPTIGRAFGGRDHTSVMYGRDRVLERRASDDAYRSVLDGLATLARHAAEQRFAERIAAPAAAIIARRVVDGGALATTMVSQREIGALALRLLALEGLAATTFELLAGIDRLALPFESYDARRTVIDRNKELTTAVADQLIELGYQQEPAHGQEETRDAGAGVHAAAAAE